MNLVQLTRHSPCFFFAKIFLVILVLFSPFIVSSCGTKNKTDNLPIISHGNKTTNVTSVHDGDTFRSGDIKYRLYGVDTPEVSNQFKNFVKTKGIEKYYGDLATHEAQMFINKHKIYMNELSVDKYSRRVVQVVTEDFKDLATDLIDKGYARVAYISDKPGDPYFTENKDYYYFLLHRQQKAKAHKKGFWKDEDEFSKIFPKA